MRGRSWFSPVAMAGLAAALLFASAPAGAGGGGNRVGKQKQGKAAKKWGKGKGASSRVDTRPPPRPRTRGVASPNAVRANSASELIFGDPIRYHNLSIVPVSTTHQGPFQKYALLEHSLAKKTLAVRELNGQSGEAQVNAVEVRNKGEHPVYLLGGEMILGGKQDRIIQRDTVVPPSGKWTRVSVFCVEQGRWQGQNMRFRSGQALAHVALRKAAMSGDQGKVWAEVARKNLKHGTQSSSGTYRRTIQNAKVRSKISPYRRDIMKKLPGGTKLAGVVFAINGQIRVADLFGNPVLFGDLKEKLLSAYILEALGEQVVRNAPTISKGAAAKWIYDARKAKKVKLKGSGRSVNFSKEAPNMIGDETQDSATGKTVRETYIKK
jgi:hypothetical protein